MSTQIRGGVSTVIAETDANGNLLVNPPVDESLAGFVSTASEVDPGTPAASIARTVRPDDTSADYRKRVGVDTPQFFRTFPGTVVNTIVWQQNLTTMTVAQSGGFLRLNSGNAVASGNVANVYSYQFFSQQLTMPIYCEMDVKYVSGAGLQANVTAELGLMNGPTGTTDPTDGAFFRYQNSQLFAVLSYGGTAGEVPILIDSSLVPAANDTAHYLIALYSDYAEFWINGRLCCRIQQPMSNGALTLSPSQQIAFRLRNTGIVASAVQIHVASAGVDLGDALSGQPWGEAMVNGGYGSWQTQDGAATPGQTALWANSAAPTAGTLSNTALPAAAYAAPGGLFDYNAPAGAVTDFIAFAYQVPAGTNTVPGKSFWVNEVAISLYNDVATVATTPTRCEWAIAVGSTALSLATADAATTRSPKRIALGGQTLSVGFVAGEGCKEGTLVRKFKDGIVVEPGTFLHFILRIPVGTATAGQRLRGSISCSGEFRLWERRSSRRATSATRNAPLRKRGGSAGRCPRMEGLLRPREEGAYTAPWPASRTP